MHLKKLIPPIVALTLLSCTPAPQYLKAQPVCRHNALTAASVACEVYNCKDDVRIDYGPSNATTYHAQARVKHNGKWVYLSVIDGQIILGKKDQFNVQHSFTMNAFYEMWFSGKHF
jgi:hypothetical protein